MAVSNFGLDTLTRYPGFGYGWSNQDFQFGLADGCSITRIVALSSGDKVKMRGKVITGITVDTSPDTVRLRIRKLFK